MAGPLRVEVAQALDALRGGELVVVADDDSRENEADLVVAASAVTPDRMSFLLRHTSGLVCAPVTGARADALALPPMVAGNTEAHRTAFTVSVDAGRGVGTGISASDRSATLRVLADPASGPADLRRPGHVFPLRARDGGVLERRGHTEAAVDLALLAGIDPVMAICELCDDRGEMLRGQAVTHFSREHDLVSLTVQDVVDHRLAAGATGPAMDPALTATPPVRMPTHHGTFTVSLWTAPGSPVEHLVLTLGEVRGRANVPVRVHSECATGDLFGSLRCDCGEQLDAALAAIADAGHGVVVYERGHEGRGIGLHDKLLAYALQDAGADTLDANLLLGHGADDRDFAGAAAVLRALGPSDVTVLTNNPQKVAALQEQGLAVRRRPLSVTPHPSNIGYLRTKMLRMGHELQVGHVETPGTMAV